MENRGVAFTRQLLSVQLRYGGAAPALDVHIQTMPGRSWRPGGG